MNGLAAKLPIVYIVRDEWRDVVTNHAARSTPCARVVAFGKHMMFWEHSDRFNEEISDFLNRLDSDSIAAGDP
ncbi:hypothetical protein OO012_07645 [Rhodobacteraceae bacterium KMM 6894]|nr:hypothetical protein [Rhodobacteraceae bacterium KMM 6894]